MSNNVPNKEFNLTNQSDILTSLITAGAAIGGGIMGSVLTYHYRVKSEERKEEKEINDENEFDKRLRLLTKEELRSYSEFLKFLGTMNKDNLNLSQEELTRIQIAFLYPNEYTKLPLQRRMKIFQTETFFWVEKAYNYYNIFSVVLKDELSKGSDRNFKDRLMGRTEFDLGGLMQLIDEAISKIDKELEVAQ